MIQFVLIAMMCTGPWCTQTAPQEIATFLDKKSCMEAGAKFDGVYNWVCGIKGK